MFSVLAAAFLSVTFTQTPGRPPQGGRPPVPALPVGTKALRDLPYVTDGHARQKLDIYLPASQPNPALVILIHGGGFMFGDKSGENPVPWLNEGFAVASIGYRLSGDALFPAAVQDCKSAVRWLRANAKRYGYDPNRFAAFGASAGGNLASLLGTTGEVSAFDVGENLRISSKVQAVASWFGPTDFLQMDAQRLPDGDRHDPANSPESRYLGGPIQERKELAQQANPIRDVSKDTPPFFLAHGDQDRQVPFGQSEILRDALAKAGVRVVFRRVPNQGHGFRDADVLAETVAFVKSVLKSK